MTHIATYVYVPPGMSWKDALIATVIIFLFSFGALALMARLNR